MHADNGLDRRRIHMLFITLLVLFEFSYLIPAGYIAPPSLSSGAFDEYYSGMLGLLGIVILILLWAKKDAKALDLQNRIVTILFLIVLVVQIYGLVDAYNYLAGNLAILISHQEIPSFLLVCLILLNSRYDAFLQLSRSLSFK